MLKLEDIPKMPLKNYSSGPEDAVKSHKITSLAEARAMSALNRFRFSIAHDNEETGLVRYYDKQEYSVVLHHVKVSNRAILHAQGSIIVHACTIVHDNAIVDARPARITIGQCCVIGRGVQLKPSTCDAKGNVITLRIGNYVHIGDESVVEAASIGDHVVIGRQCVLPNRCIISSCSMVLEGTKLTPGTVVPPFAIFGGNPGLEIGQLPSCSALLIKQLCLDTYRHFQPSLITKDS